MALSASPAGAWRLKARRGRGTTVRLHLPRSVLPAAADDEALSATASVDSERLVPLLEDETDVPANPVRAAASARLP